MMAGYWLVAGVMELKTMIESLVVSSGPILVASSARKLMSL
jgi:hypothetical protein